MNEDSLDPGNDPSPVEQPSPYDPPLTESRTLDAPPQEARPRIVFAILVPILAIIAGTIASIVVAGAAIALVSGGDLDPDDMSSSIEDLFKRPWALLAMLVPGQLVFGLAAVGAAQRSPVALTRRLDLRAGQMPKWTWIVMGLAAPAASLPMVLLFHFVEIEPSEQLQMLAGMMMQQTGAMLFVTGFMVSVVPAIVEETLFRGYLQSRLLRRLPAAAAILISALIFSIAHLDPMHAMGVFPLGIWLGLVAWRAGSIYPAILGHFFNNLFGFVSTQFAEEAESTKLTMADIPILAVLVGLMMLSLFLMFRRHEQPPTE